VHAEAIGNECRADHQEEAEGQHDDRRVPGDEARERVGGDEHGHHGDEDGGDHDGDVVGHADRCDDAVEREHEIENEDLHDGGAEAQHRHGARAVLLLGFGIDVLVDLGGRLPDEEEAAADQDEVAPREGMAEGGEQRRRQLDDVGDGAQKREPQDKRRADADAPGLGLLVRRKLVG
jgi:hypothetical protein